MLCAVMKVLSNARAKTKTKTLQWFNISHFYWSVSSDIMAVKYRFRSSRTLGIYVRTGTKKSQKKKRF